MSSYSRNGFQLRDVAAVDVAVAVGGAAVGAARNSIKLINEASESSREARQGNMACHLKISFRYNFLFPACQTARQARPKGPLHSAKKIKNPNIPKLWPRA